MTAEKLGTFGLTESAGLFVGVSIFEDPRFPTVPFAADDAVDLAYLFTLELGLILPKHAVVLLSGEPQKGESIERLTKLIERGVLRKTARMRDLYSYTSQLARNPKCRDLFVLAVASHGVSDQGGDHVIATDSLGARPVRTGVAVSEIFDEVSRAVAGCRLVLLDACRERLTEGTRGEVGSGMAQSFADAIARAKGSVVLSAATSGGFAYDDPRRKNGVFTAAVMDGLRGEAMPNPEGWITVRTLADFVQERVVAWVSLNRPDHAERCLGIGRQVDSTAEALPLARHPLGGRKPIVTDGAGSTAEVWVPEQGSPRLDELYLFDLVPELFEFKQDGLQAFSMVEFEVPGYGNVRGWWQDHLDALVRNGLIHAWSRTETNAPIIGLRDQGILYATALSNSRVLCESEISIQACTPLVQEPVHAKGTSSHDVKYPDLPIRAEYFGLIKAPDGRRLAALLKYGDEIPQDIGKRSIQNLPEGNLLVRWVVQVCGRKEPLVVQLSVTQPCHQAHWMIWPRFRTRSRAGWKAYYVYAYCTDPRLACDVLWLEHSEGVAEARILRRFAHGAIRWPLPPCYRTGSEISFHSGGPPVALGLYNLTTGEERGIYLVGLQVLPEVSADLSIAVDFGFSHTVAAYRVSDGAPQPIQFGFELESLGQCLSLHISEDRYMVEAPEKDGGIIASGTWMPTYRRRQSETSTRDELLPTELLLARKPKWSLEDIGDWCPCSDYMIPSLTLETLDFAEYVVTGFRDVSGFRARARNLCELYLTLFMELAFAEIIDKVLGGFPGLPVRLTFTVPIKSSMFQVVEFREVLYRVGERLRLSLGVPMTLEDGVGIYPEPWAARVASNVTGEVCLVADLGGNSLDLFITASRHGGSPLGEVAESVRLGGDCFLRKLAVAYGERPWTQAELSLMRLWMRTGRSGLLLDFLAKREVTSEEWKITEALDKSGELFRVLLRRYFSLIEDYLARNLVAFLVGCWFPEVNPRNHNLLLISIQPRGNGWRLLYGNSSYLTIARHVRHGVRNKVKLHWDEVQGNSYPFPKNGWEALSRFARSDLKTEAARNSLGRYSDVSEFVRPRQSYPLVDLEVFDNESSDRSLVNWSLPLPYTIPSSSQIELREIRPPIVFDDACGGRRTEACLDGALLAGINYYLQNEASFEAAPRVGQLVWEAVLDSLSLWRNKVEEDPA